jgi:glutamyl-tRNA synthetase
MTGRTRIAPSPTGDPHVGTAYIALFNLCFARQHGGQFLLRIEDTDQERSTPESEKAILDSLRWLGLEWDEGPDVGGPHGPYRQSERKHIYKQYAEELIAKGHAFYCYRTPEELDALRQSIKEQGLNRALKPSDLVLPADEVEKRKAANAPYVIRMNVPESGKCEIHDLLRGELDLDWAQVDAQILMKSDGMPTYHLANVVDDHLMQITHVMRGEEWINSAPKHKLLYQYFGWDMPVLCHLPLLRNPDKSKLSKRKNPTGILYYKKMGFLPEGLLNYLGRMGWSMPDEREKFSLTDMITNFDIQRVSLGGPIFDMDKLRWLNGQWLREELSPEQLINRLHQWAFNKERLQAILPHALPRIEVMSDLAPLVSFLFAGQMPITPDSFSALKLDEEELLKRLQFLLWRLEALRSWQRDEIFATVKQLGDEMSVKLRDMMPLLFISIAGTQASISVVDSMELLGADVSRARLRHAIEILGGLGKKRLDKLEKAYRQLGITAVDGNPSAE